MSKADEGKYSIRIERPDGKSVYAWAEHWQGEPYFHVHRRRASEQPEHQPFEIPLDSAAGILAQLTAFAEHTRGELGRKKPRPQSPRSRTRRT